MRKPRRAWADCLARGHLGSHLLRILCTSLRGKLSCSGSVFRGPLYTIIGQGKQCARPGKRMRALANRLANYVKHDVRAMLGYLGEIASRVLLRAVPLCEINRAIRKEVHSMYREIGSFAIASYLTPLFLERESEKSRERERLSPSDAEVSKGQIVPLLHFSTRVVITDVRD